MFIDASLGIVRLSGSLKALTASAIEGTAGWITDAGEPCANRPVLLKPVPIVIADRDRFRLLQDPRSWATELVHRNAQILCVVTSELGEDAEYLRLLVDTIGSDRRRLDEP